MQDAVPDILHSMTIISPNSALLWSRVDDWQRKRRGRRTLRCLAGLIFSFVFINTVCWQQNISLKRLRAYDGTYTQDSDHQRITTTYWPGRIQSTQNTVGLVLNWRMKPLVRPAVSYGLEFSAFPTRDHWAGRGAALRRFDVINV